MKVTADQFKMGLVGYIDDELISKMQGWKKWALAAESATLVDRIVNALMSGKMLEHMVSSGYATEDGMVDVDVIYGNYSSAAKKYGPITETFPLIGSVTFSASDIDSIRRHMG
jgi:hypothetical protein